MCGVEEHAHGEWAEVARQYRGITLKEAADALGTVPSALSRLEEARLAPPFVERIAKLYRFPLEFFSLDEWTHWPPMSVHTIRTGARPKLSTREFDMIAGEFNLRAYVVGIYVDGFSQYTRAELPHLEIARFGSAREIAAEVRAGWKLRAGPIRNLTRLMERARIIIGESRFGGAAVSGVSFKVFCAPPLVVINPAYPADELRYALAHELGHLFMHRDPVASMEEEADEFALAFLLPPEEMKDVFRDHEITLELLASLKKQWGVPVRSLLFRAQSLGSLSSDKVYELEQQMNSREWRAMNSAQQNLPLDRPTAFQLALRSVVESRAGGLPRILARVRLYEDDFTELFGDINAELPRDPYR